MNRTLNTLVATLFVAAVGCDRAEQPALSRASTNDVALPGVSDAEVFDGHSIVVTAEDGAVQEEVVTFAGGLPAAEGSEQIDVPEVVLAALDDAPVESDDVGQPLPSNVSLIVSSEDGAVQEEVVLVDDLGDNAPTRETAESDAVLVASLLSASL